MSDFFPGGGGTTDVSGKMDVDGNNGAITYTNFTPSAAPTYTEGRVWYDSDSKALSFYDDHSGTSIQIGKELVVDARNNTGVQIDNGKVVYISGATGQHPTIALAKADSASTSQIIGVATHDIPNNTIGKITFVGLVNDIDTSAFSDGNTVYVSATAAGILTATPPASPNFVAPVGYIAHAHPTQGKILVIDERTLTNNDALGTSQSLAPTENAVKNYVDANHRYIQSTTLASGSGAFVVDSVARLLRIRVWGATGGAGGVDGQGAGTYGIAGAGGNGGYSEKWILISPGETFTYSIGAAGVGAAAGNNAGTGGGTTSFTGSVFGTVQVTGGSGGLGILAVPGNNSALTQGAGGVASGGDINLDGSKSYSGRWHQGDIHLLSNNGSPLFGFGAVANGISGDGADSGGIGAGGLGGQNVSQTATNYGGGNGFVGQIIVEEWT